MVVLSHPGHVTIIKPSVGALLLLLSSVQLVLVGTKSLKVLAKKQKSPSVDRIRHGQIIAFIPYV